MSNEYNIKFCDECKELYKEFKQINDTKNSWCYHKYAEYRQFYDDNKNDIDYRTNAEILKKWEKSQLYA